MKMRGLLGLVGVIGIGACAGSAINVGPGAGGAPAGIGSGGTPGTGGATSQPGEGTCADLTPLPDWPSASACAGDQDSPLVGRWHGYLENEDAPWDELFLDIKGANSDGLCGTLTVGTAAPPSPASDPTQSYPPGIALPAWPLLAGYASTLLEGRLDGTRIRFGVSPTEGYRSWCEVQTPYQLVGSGGAAGRACSCTPAGSTLAAVNETNHECTLIYTVNGAPRTFGCMQETQCGACACNASGCVPAGGYVNRFDLTANGDTLEGSDTDHAAKRIHFTRVR